MLKQAQPEQAAQDHSQVNPLRMTAEEMKLSFSGMHSRKLQVSHKKTCVLGEAKHWTGPQKPHCSQLQLGKGLCTHPALSSLWPARGHWKLQGLACPSSPVALTHCITHSASRGWEPTRGSSHAWLQPACPRTRCKQVSLQPFDSLAQGCHFSAM